LWSSGTEAPGLPTARHEHLGANVRGRGSRRHLGELREGDGGDLDMEIDPIQKRS
jgi:hypothetical protein